MRRRTSIILTLTFIIISVTGIMLLGKHNPGNNFVRLVAHIHELVGILFIIAGLVHLKLNFKAMLSYAKYKHQQNKNL